MKQNIKRIILCVVITMTMQMVATAANVAADILNKAVSRYQSVPSLTVDFNITTPDAGSVAGTLVTAGDRFRLELPGMQTWYDGRTQWSYLQSVNEVNITEPTVEELAQINPFAIVSAIKGTFTPTLVSSNQKRQVVRFTPTASGASDISSMTVTFDASTSWPQMIELVSSAGKVVITVTGVKTGGKLPASAFVYNKKTHPGAEIVDLR